MTGQPRRPSRLVTWAAYSVPLIVLPSALWRVTIGWNDNPACPSQGPWEPYYVAGLSVVSLLVASLTVGLVRPWGTTFPEWLPLLGRRRVPYRLVTAVAGTGAALILVIAYLYPVLNGIFHFKDPVRIPGCPPPTETEGAWLVYAAYMPLLAWAPLLIVVVTSYYRRHADAA